MNDRNIDEAIYNRYIAPTKRRRTQKVGLEFELPIVRYEKKPVDFEVVHALTDAFIKRFSFGNIQRDDEGNIYSAVCDKTGDGLSYDCSYNTLEFSFGTEEDINLLNLRFRDYYTFANDYLNKYNHTLTGMGINPRFKVNNNVPVLSERYRMLLHHLSSYKLYGNAIPFHDNPNFGLFSCANQVQLDVDEDSIAQTINIFGKLEPVKTLLLANSVWGENNEILCSRDNFWKNSLHGLNRHNVDMCEVEFEGTDDIVAYIRSMSIYCVQREGKYINFPPMLLTDYFSADSVTGEYFDKDRYREIIFKPELADIEYLRAFKFEDLTFRGTVEFRSVCEQPISEIMASGAFHAGLMEKLPELKELLDKDRALYHKGYNASELRAILNRKHFPEFINKKEVSELLVKVVELAESGLKKRGFGEEKYLEPLYIRAERVLSPAREMAEGLESGKPIEHYIEQYGRL